MSKRVIVSMSGGVDSSIAAALLKNKGHEVIGATLQFWPKKSCGKTKPKSCCSLKDIEDARKVAAKLKIPFYVFNVYEEFQKHVIDYFCSEYSRGRTPNPCIPCNDKIKFNFLIKKAEELAADYVATGHYARISYSRKHKRYILKRSRYLDKDQSYALFNLSQKQLSSILFPIGGVDKPEARKRALKLGLQVHDKPDSQDICFIWDGDYKKFLRQRTPELFVSGDIVDTKGEILGRHKGVACYTIGQREGLGISGPHPFYVTQINSKNNTIVVGTRQQAHKKVLTASKVSWIGGNTPSGKIKVQAKIRYRHKGAKVVIKPLQKTKVEVSFEQPQFAVTPGQAVVFYDNDEVLGGGWIE